MLAVQRDRWLLWLPVAMIFGAALWLLAPRDPPPGLSPALLLAGLSAAIALACWPSARAEGADVALRSALAGVCALVAAAGLGGLAAEIRTAATAQAPILASETPVRIEGWVVAVEPSERGPRLRLLVRAIEGVDAPPRYVRLAVPQAGVLTPGRAAQCRGVLGPPSGAMAPGAYDFARRAYFERLGATGFAFGRCRPAAFEPPPGLLDRLRLDLAAMRSDLAAAIYAAAPGRGGAIAAALVTGDRSGVDEPTNAVLRDSGLGHLLSVSGVHMGVVGGLVFAALIWTLALIAPLALRWPVKKLAAIGALTALALYLIVSGSSVPALRAFVMAAVAFGAILLDRPAISMRGLALAAMIVVLVFPESVLEPGFQMSFAATMALVALFEMLHRGPRENDLPSPGPLIGSLQWSARAIGGVIGVSLVAGLATDPFAIYHFQRFSLYALPANLAVAPIMSFLVAPAAGVAALLAPFGLADPALDVMASALDLVAAIGEAFGARPEAVRALPRPPDAAFILCVGALLWACLWRGHLRWGGLALFVAAIGLYAAAPRPVLAFDGDLRAVYARQAEAPVWALIGAGGRSTYARDKLGAMIGVAPVAAARLAPPEACGAALCAWTTPGGRLAFLVRDASGFAPACRRNALIIAAAHPPSAAYGRVCAPSLLIAPEDLAARGGGFVYETPSALRAEWAATAQIHRPWTPVRASLDQE